MRFAIGFVVGAAIGRPVLKAISRRISLTDRVQAKVAFFAYRLGDTIAGEKFHPNYQKREDRR
jgi:hypothetical protein